VIHFKCPKCEREHDRGYINGVDTFRCLNCGYVGFGFHPDEEIDAQIGQEIRQAQAWNVAHGLPAGPFAP
jgi:Zn ribbon nucleic-acid-binding protein